MGLTFLFYVGLLFSIKILYDTLFSWVRDSILKKINSLPSNKLC